MNYTPHNYKQLKILKYTSKKCYVNNSKHSINYSSVYLEQQVYNIYIIEIVVKIKKIPVYLKN